MSDDPAATGTRAWPWPQTLRGAVLATVIVGLAVPAAIALLVEYRLAEQAAQRELRADLSRTTRLLAVALQAPLWDLSEPYASAVVRAVADDARLVSVVVTDSTTRQPFVTLQRADAAPPDAVTAELPIVREGAEIGRIRLAMSPAVYRERALGELRLAVARGSLALGIALLLILLVLRRRLIRPVQQLALQAEALADGRFEQSLAWHSRDELRPVADAMEKMRLALLAALAEIRAKNATLEEHAAALESRVAARTRELSAANAELQAALVRLRTTQGELLESERLASLGRLVAGVAHELSTPLGNALTVVTTLEHLLQEIAAAFSAGELRRARFDGFLARCGEGQDLLRRNVHKAAELVRNFKQLAIDQTTDMRRRFDLAQTLQEVVVTISPQFKAAPCRIELDLAQGLVMDSYPGPLGQVITNLLLNARVHAFEGRETGVVRLAARPLGEDRVEIVCQDDGRGMAEDVARRVFEPFFTTRFGNGGSGLGMHIAYTIVTGLLGGHIRVQTAPDTGSRFSVDLPRVAPPAAGDPASNAAGLAASAAPEA